MLTVRSTRTDGRVVLFERDERHPDGEAFVASDAPAEVGDTPMVRLKIAQGSLELVEQPKPAKSTPHVK